MDIIKCGIYTRWSPRPPKCPKCNGKAILRLDALNFICKSCTEEFPDTEASSSSKCQEQRCREYAAEKGYEVVWCFDEPCTSGAGDDMDPSPEAWYTARPKLYEAILSLKPGMVLLVTKRDRIGRSVLGLGIVRLDIARHGCRIEACDEPNGDAPENILMQTMMSAFAEYERHLICARIRGAMRIHKQNGRRMVSAERIPYGYHIDPTNDKMMLPDEYEQENIDLARSYLESNPNATGYAICQYLDSIGRTRRGGKTWENSSRLADSMVGRVKKPAKRKRRKATHKS